MLGGFSPNKKHLLYKVRILPRTPCVKNAHHFKWVIPLFHMEIYPFLYKNEFSTTNFPHGFHTVFHFPLLINFSNHMVKPYNNGFCTTKFPYSFCTVYNFHYSTKFCNHTVKPYNNEFPTTKFPYSFWSKSQNTLHKKKQPKFYL